MLGRPTGAATLAVLALLLVAGSTRGHASPDPLDNEVHVIADETSDIWAVLDGFDIQDVFVREAHFGSPGADGVVVRVILYGGPPPGVPSPQTLTVSLAGTDFVLTSSDGIAWSGEAEVVGATLEPSEDGAGLAGSLQVFVPLAAVGLALGDTLDGITVHTAAGGQPVDDAPGPSYLAGQPVETGTSTVLLESLELKGPGGYTRTNVAARDEIQLDIENLITVTGQHITVSYDTPAGWTIEAIDATPKSVDAGVHPKFTFRAMAQPGSADWQITVRTDLGGRESVNVSASMVKAPGAAGVDAGSGGGGGSPGDGSGAADDKDSPGALLPVVAVALGAAAATRRR